MKASYDVAIVGATGAVGSMVLSILEERQFPVKQLFLLASERSVGDMLDFKGKAYLLEDLASFDFTKTQICFFCTNNQLSEKYAPLAAKNGNVVIDKSSHFRYEKNVPLIVPEVNIQALEPFDIKNIIANPNCNTIPLVVALKPIYDAVGISRINVATYQSVSGSGKDGITELADETASLLNGKPFKPKVYPEQIAFNVLPHIDEEEENGYTKEELKMVWETQKIFNDSSIKVNPTAVRVPVFYSHSAAVHIETKSKITVKEAIKLFKKADGIKLSEGKHNYMSPVNAAGKDLVYVGRIREDLSHDHGLNLWVVTDNLRKGAALNAVQIAEQVVERYL